MQWPAFRQTRGDAQLLRNAKSGRDVQPDVGDVRQDSLGGFVDALLGDPPLDAGTGLPSSWEGPGLGYKTPATALPKEVTPTQPCPSSYPSACSGNSGDIEGQIASAGVPMILELFLVAARWAKEVCAADAHE